MANDTNIPFLAQPGPAPDPLPFAAPVAVDPAKQVSAEALKKLDEATLSERALKNHVALGEDSPGAYVLQRYEQAGQLDAMVQQIADRKASDLMQQKDQVVRALATSAAKEGRQLSSVEEQAIYNLSKKEWSDFRQDPQQFLNTQYAQKVTEMAAARNERSPFDLLRRENQDAALDTVDRFQDYVAKKEGFHKLYQEAEANARKQSWGGWIVDRGKEVLPIYSWYQAKSFIEGAPPSSFLPGSSLQNQISYLYSLPADKANALASKAIREMMVDNPALAKNFAEALLSYSSSQAFWDNLLIAGADISTVLPFGKITKGVKALPTVGGNLASLAAHNKTLVNGVTRFGDALYDLGRAATSRNPSSAQVASAAGDVEKSAALSSVEKLQKWREDLGGRSISDFKELDNEIMTTMDPMRVLDGPRYNMSAEGARRLVDFLQNSTDQLLKKMFFDPLQTEYRLTPEVLRTVTRQAYDNFMITYRRLEDTIIDLSQKTGDGAGLVMRLGKNNAELFDSVTQATMMMRDVYGLPEKAFVVKGYGDKFYGEIFRPFDMTTDAVKTARQKDVLVETGAKTPIGGWIARYVAGWRSTDYVVPKDVREVFKQAVVGGSVLLDIVQDLAKTIPKIKDPSDFYKFLKYQQTKPDPLDKTRLGVFSKTVGEFETDFHGLIGRLPTEAETTGYFAYTRINDMHYMHVNLSIYLDKLAKGLMQFRLPDIASGMFEGKLVKALPETKEEAARVLVLANGQMPMVINTKHSPTKLKKPVYELVADGSHQVIQLSSTGSRAIYDAPELASLLKDKNIGGIQFIVVKNPDSAPIPFKQIPYRAGGHHSYPAGSFIRQPQVYTTDNGAVAKYYGDTNFMWAPNAQLAEDFSKRLETARAAMHEVFDSNGRRRRDISNDVVTSFNALVEQTVPWSPSEFKQMFYGKKAVLNPRLPFMVSASDVSLANAHDLSKLNPKARFVKDSDSAYNLYRGMPNAQYAMERGDTLQAVANTGTKEKPIYGITPAPLLDPMQALERSARSFANGRYMEDLKIGTAERFMAEFGNLLDLSTNSAHKIDPFLAATAAPFLSGLTGEKAIQAKAGEVFRDRWLQFMGMSKSADEKFLAAQAEKVLGGVSPDLATGFRKDLYEILSDPISPFEKLKGLAFHMKIGLWNVKQLLTQAAGAVHVVAVAGPKIGSQAIAMSMIQNLVVRRGDDVTEAGAKLLVKLGFRDKEQFLECTRAMERSNFDHVGREVANREQHMNARVVMTTAGKVLDSGTTPFKISEQFIRRSGWNAAYLEWRAVEPTAKLTDKVIAKILDRADELSGNMTQASNAAWQQGMLGVSTQFMSYQIRLTEQLLNKKLTDRDLYKMLAVYSTAWGLPVAGTMATFGMLPMHEQTKEYLLSKGINLEDNLIARVLHNGVLDLVGDTVFGQNMNVTKTFGPGGPSPILEVMRSDKNFFAAALGAGGSVFGEMLVATAPFLRPLWGVVDPYGAEAPSLKLEDFEALIAPISTAKAIDKAIVAMATGNYYSKKGELLDRGNTGISALMQAAFGLQPQRIDDLYSLRRSEKDRAVWLGDKQQQVYRFLEKMFKAETTDERAEYHRKAITAMVGYGFTEMERMDTMRGFFTNNRHLPLLEKHLISHQPKSPKEQELYDNLRKSWILPKN